MGYHPPDDEHLSRSARNAPERSGCDWAGAPYSSPMSKFNNKFSFYMLIFCGTGTIFNLALLNLGKWSV